MCQICKPIHELPGRFLRRMLQVLRHDEWHCHWHKAEISGPARGGSGIPIYPLFCPQDTNIPQNRKMCDTKYLKLFWNRILNTWKWTEFKSVDRPARLLQFPNRLVLKPLYFFLTWVSFRDFPLRYETRGGSFKMFLRYGWFCIRCYFQMSMFLRLGNAGWYFVTKGMKG